jgi:UPF0755 protein
MDFFERLVPAAFTALEFHFLRFKWQWGTAFVAVVLVGGYFFIFSPPDNFPFGSIVLVPAGASAAEVATELSTARVVTHPLVLRLLLRLEGADRGVQSGAYRFQSPENLFSVARRITTGAYGLPVVRATFTEGMTVRDMAARVADAFPFISGADFSSAARPYEGYLFPDTYFFSPSVTVDEIIATMRTNFDTKIKTLSPDIAASGHSLSDIVIMASLVEKEARTSANRRIVAGILWNRLEKNMPLQVDAVFGYINNRDTYSPSPSDLKVDSPYNTYTHRGLPPGPIANPGLDSLDAAVNPTKTDYFYYLTGSDNQMHYATTYAAHQANLKKYLK